MKAYAATVRLLLPADIESEAEAADAISALLTEGGIYENALLDWSYLPDGGGGWLHAEEVEISNDYDRDEDQVPLPPSDPVRDAAPAMADRITRLEADKAALLAALRRAEVDMEAEGFHDDEHSTLGIVRAAIATAEGN